MLKKGVDIVLVFIFFCFKKKKNICLIEQYVVKFRWNMIKIVKKKNSWEILVVCKVE